LPVSYSIQHFSEVHIHRISRIFFNSVVLDHFPKFNYFLFFSKLSDEALNLRLPEVVVNIDGKLFGVEEVFFAEGVYPLAPVIAFANPNDLVIASLKLVFDIVKPFEVV